MRGIWLKTRQALRPICRPEVGGGARWRLRFYRTRSPRTPTAWRDFQREAQVLA